MKTIYKYTLEVTDEQTVNMPSGAKILHLEEQHSSICMWALVDREEPNIARIFQIFGTGHQIPESALRTYIATVLTDQGRFAWHVFERA